MTEQQYIDATNLAKLRIVKEILRDTLFMDAADDERNKIIFRLVYAEIERLEVVVTCEPTADPPE